MISYMKSSRWQLQISKIVISSFTIKLTCKCLIRSKKRFLFSLNNLSIIRKYTKLSILWLWVVRSQVTVNSQVSESSRARYGKWVSQNSHKFICRNASPLPFESGWHRRNSVDIQQWFLSNRSSWRHSSVVHAISARCNPLVTFTSTLSPKSWNWSSNQHVLPKPYNLHLQQWQNTNQMCNAWESFSSVCLNLPLQCPLHGELDFLCISKLEENSAQSNVALEMHRKRRWRRGPQFTRRVLEWWLKLPPIYSSPSPPIHCKSIL